MHVSLFHALTNGAEIQHHSAQKNTEGSLSTQVYACQDEGENLDLQTCDRALKQGEMPAHAEANNLDLVDIPMELADQNPLEILLISLRIPFVKILALLCCK